MLPAPFVDLSDTDVGCGASVCVAGVDEAGLSDEGLRSRLAGLGRAESRLAALKSRALAELSRRHSKADAQRLVRDELGSSNREAKRDVETAERLAELPATAEALESGEIPAGHARLIARAAAEAPVDEGLLVEAAGEQRFDEFAKTVKRHQRDVAVDDGAALLERQRSQRRARIFESAESGMFILNAEFDPVTGARVATALTGMERRLWNREDPKARVTPQQRMADALTELICEPDGAGGSAGTDLLVIADFDTITAQLDNPRLADGTPIPIGELHRLALDANILPAIFDTKAQNLWLGRRQRTVNEAQRMVLTARDQGCIGCGADPSWSRAHHIKFWRDDGPTDINNLVLVCDRCHHNIHDQDRQVRQNPETGKYTLQPPTHHAHPRRSPAPLTQPGTITITINPNHRPTTTDGTLHAMLREKDARPRLAMFDTTFDSRRAPPGLRHSRQPEPNADPELPP